MILAWASAHHVVHYTRFLAPLKHRIARDGRWKKGKCDLLLLVDTGFESPKLTDRRLALPIRRGGKLVDPDRKAGVNCVSQTRLDGLFGQRWISKPVYSGIKRLFEDAICSRS
jgi:hypothetical protein